MSGFWEKVVDWLGAIAKPWQVLLVFAVGSGVFLTDLFKISSYFGVVEDVAKYKLLFAIVFVTTLTLLFLRVSLAAFGWVSKKSKKIASNRLASRINVSTAAQVILGFVEGHKPDYVQLLREHPDVRELRRHSLIRLRTH